MKDSAYNDENAVDPMQHGLHPVVFTTWDSVLAFLEDLGNQQIL